jgi:hypothetical protein
MSWRSLLPTDAWVRWLLVPVVAFIALAGNTSYLADFWHHLARGRAMIAEGRLLDHDIFTCTVPGQTFQDVNWLSQIIYFQLFELGGLALVRAVNALLVAVTLLWLVALCRRVSGSLPVALGLGIAVFLGLWDVLTIRPQTFSLLLFVGLLDLLERSERRPWLLVAPPLVLALWANLHGAFPAGLMLLGCEWLAGTWWAWRLRTPAAVRHGALLTSCFVASVLATLVNPYGWNIYRYVGATSSLAAARGIDEWLPPALDQRIGLAFFASVPIVAGMILLAWKRRGAALPVRELLLLGCFLPLACGSVRMVAWWLIVIAPMLAWRMTLLWPTFKSDVLPSPNRGAACSVAVLLAIAVLSLPGLQRFNPLYALRPIDSTTAEIHEAQAFLTREFSGSHVFTRFEWGEYLCWAAHPHCKVFMDGRIEIYPTHVWQAYSAVTCGQPGWREILDSYYVDVLLLDTEYHRRTGLLEQVESSPHWQRRHQTGKAVLFVRASALAVR